MVFCQKILRGFFRLIVDSATVAIFQTKLLGVISPPAMTCLKICWKGISFLFIPTQNFGAIQIAAEIKTQPQRWRIVLKFKASSVSSSFFMALLCSSLWMSERVWLYKKSCCLLSFWADRLLFHGRTTTLLPSYPGRATGIISRNIRENFLESGQMWLFLSFVGFLASEQIWKCSYWKVFRNLSKINPFEYFAPHWNYKKPHLMQKIPVKFKYDSRYWEFRSNFDYF